MKGIRVISLLLSVIILFGCLGQCVYAYEASDHNDRMWEVLLGKNDTKSNGKISSHVEALQYASAIAIDHIKEDKKKSSIDGKNKKGNNEDGFTYLKKTYKVKGIVDKLSDIEYSSSEGGHRKYTHQGWNIEDWNISYTSEDVKKDVEKKWPKRQKILVNTVKKCCNFKDGIFKKDTRYDNLAALIYYVHILADYQSDNEHKKDKNENEKMPLVSVGNSKSVSAQLKKHISFLFPNQKDSSDYRLLEKKIKSIEREAVRKGSNKENNAETAKKLIEALSEYIPKLLEKEDFWDRTKFVSTKNEDTFKKEDVDNSNSLGLIKWFKNLFD